MGRSRQISAAEVMAKPCWLASLSSPCLVKMRRAPGAGAKPSGSSGGSAEKPGTAPARSRARMRSPGISRQAAPSAAATTWRARIIA